MRLFCATAATSWLMWMSTYSPQSGYAVRQLGLVRFTNVIERSVDGTNWSPICEHPVTFTNIEPGLILRSRFSL